MIVAKGKGGVGAGWRWAKEGGMGTSVIESTIKKNKKVRILKT